MTEIIIELEEYQEMLFKAALDRANENRAYRTDFFKSKNIDIEVKPITAKELAKSFFIDALDDFIESESIIWAKERVKQDV